MKRTAAPNITELERVARSLRAQAVEMSHRAGTPHLGSQLSVVDMLVALYWAALRIDPKNPSDPARDRCILSKGHAAPVLYAVLAARGFISNDLLSTYAQRGSVLAEQPVPNAVPGIEAATGSLGHGLPIGVGMALANRIHGRASRVFVVMSDGECNEGSVWEAALVAPAQRLERLVVLIDFNKWQATGRSEEVTGLAPLADKWRAFGWRASEVDGHDLGALTDALASIPEGSGKPTAIVCHTVKGKGVSFMEDDNNWHYRIPNADELQRAKQELGLA